MSQADIQGSITAEFRTGIRAGTHVKTKFMRPFISKSSSAGIYSLDLDITMSRIEAAAKFIKRTGPENLLACSGKQKASVPVIKLCEAIGAKPMTGRFMPGTLTNPSLEHYIEPKLLLVSDPQIDEQAVVEATNAGIPVIGISNTNNITSNLDLVIPANNVGQKALAAVYWLLAKHISPENISGEIEDFETKDD